MATRTTRRLPGFRFEVQAPNIPEPLPRMDIAVFVGFAASGPLHTPVAVEDPAQFATIFGADAPLVWDAKNSEQVYAYLGPAVRSFFENGGRRCWIIRVASATAQSNCFPIPNLARARFSESGAIEISPACAYARSEGRWSDSVKTSATIFRSPIRITSVSDYGFSAEAVLASGSDVRAGDLIRVKFDAGYELFFSVAVVAGSTLSASHAIWLRTSFSDSPPADVAAETPTAWMYTSAGDDRQLEPQSLTVVETEWDSDDSLTIDVQLSASDAPAPGSLLRLDYGEDQFWFAVQELGITVEEGSSTDVVRLGGQGVWIVSDPPETLTGISGSELLTFNLHVREGEEYSLSLTDLGFDPGHDRFWAQLPSDAELYDSNVETEETVLWPSTADTRFPLAASETGDAIYIPIMMPLATDYWLGPLEVSAEALERDGLAEFSEDLFIDPDMAGVGQTALMSRADFLRYLSSSPRALKGMHAALAIEEATIIAAPDAVHRKWTQAEETAATPPEESDPPARPEWWHFMACDPKAKIPLTREPRWDQFIDCSIEVIEAPALQLAEGPDTGGTFRLTWSSIDSAAYVLEESTTPDFSGAVTVYSGAKTEIVLYGRPVSDYYYRIYAKLGCQRSDWSDGLSVRVTPAVNWLMETPEDYSAGALYSIHSELLRMCAARGDLFAVLVLPEHYREDEALDYADELKLVSGADNSFGALYHPWLIGRTTGQATELRRLPSDGAACGIMAQRSTKRGAWVAPANEMLRGVIALTPLILPERWLELQEAQVNIIRREPRGFVCLSADTLTGDEDLRPINVRRLMTLLRRLALRVGARYVFEPNDDSFRRAVQRGFEAVLDEMFLRGAFAGSTPATSYQVVTDATLNTPPSVDMGRFIVEIKVAPSLPLTFLTVRLVQSGDRAVVTEG